MRPRFARPWTSAGPQRVYRYARPWLPRWRRKLGAVGILLKTLENRQKTTLRRNKSQPGVEQCRTTLGRQKGAVWGRVRSVCRAARERLPRLLLEWRIDDLRLVVGGRPADSPDLAARIAPVVVDLHSEGDHLKQTTRLTAVRTGAMRHRKSLRLRSDRDHTHGCSKLQTRPQRSVRRFVADGA
jgi:hypothetical protein